MHPREEHWPHKETIVPKAPIRKSNKKIAKESNVKKTKIPLDALPEEVLINILSYLQHIDCVRAAGASNVLKNVSTSPQILIGREMLCFHSKVSYQEDILGVGINMDYTPLKVLQSITTPMDLVSQSAFQSGLRKGVWNHPFKYWIPLYINKSHGDKAMGEVFDNAVRQCYVKEMVKNRNDHIATLSVDILCKLMSSMVVEMMKGELHASLRALEYYGHFHRLLIYVVLQYPGLKELINKKIEQFVASG